MELNEAIVLKISKRDKEIIRELARLERLSMSAYIRQKMCVVNK
jgi:hypothetical protein